MKIVVQLCGTYHSPRVVEELSGRGHTVSLLTTVPHWHYRRRVGSTRYEHRAWWPIEAVGARFLRRMGVGGTTVCQMEILQAQLLDEVGYHTLRGRCPDLFIGFNRFCLKTLKLCAAEGIPTIVERGAASERDRVRVLNHFRAIEGIPNSGMSASMFVEREMEECRIANAIVVPSEGARRSFLSDIDLNKIIVNPYGIDASAYAFVGRQKLGKLKVLMVGNLGFEKGIHVAVRALNQMSTNVECLTTVGVLDGFAKRCLADARFPHKHLGHLKLLELSEEYGRADVLLLPSLQDGFGLVGLESLAAGTPVISSANAGVSELMQNQFSKFICQPNDVNSLVGALSELVARASEYGAIREQCRALSLLHSWEAYGARYAGSLAALARNNRSV